MGQTSWGEIRNQVLSVLAAEDRPLTAMELEARVSKNRRYIYQLMGRLERQGVVRKTTTRPVQYVLSSKPWTTSKGSLAQNLSEVRAELSALRRQFDETHALLNKLVTLVGG